MLERLLIRAGFPPCSPWWRREIERFLLGERRRWVLRVGRRGGKSSTLSRLFVVWVLFGDWYIPPGDTAVVAIVSIDRSEASQRLTTIEAILRTLGVRFERVGQEILIPERRAKFSVKTCSTTGTIGFTSIALFGDEMARWESRDTAANPAREVMASLRPSMATQPNGFEIDCSAPWSVEDYHHELFSAGTNGEQVTSFAATWEANPTLSEQDTRELEPDEKLWSRAYAAIPGASITGDWFGGALDGCLLRPRVAEPVLSWVRYLVSIDPAFDKDHFGWSVASCRTLPADPRLPDRPRRLVRVHECGAWKPNGARPVELAYRLRDEVCKKYHIGSVAEEDGTAWVISDQYEGQSFSDLARQAGIVLQIVPWTAGNSERTQIARYRSVRLAMMEGALWLPDDPELVAELRQVGGKLLPSGNESIVLPRARKGGHMDRVSAMVAGASELLLRSPQPELMPAVELDAGQEEKQREIRRIMDKRIREMQQDPFGPMRRATQRGIS